MPKGFYDRSKAAQNNGLFKKGVIFSKERQAKTRVPRIYKKGRKSRGSPSEETRKKISEGVLRNPRPRHGIYSGTWKGGISKDKAHIAELGKKWTKENYNRKLYLNNRRRALKLSASGNHTEGEWENLKAQYNWTCPACKKKEPEIKLSVDHIVPLSKGGSHNIENIQPLCRSCNSKKHDNTIKYEC